MAITYQDRANIYWKQANELLQKGEWSKASELAWGSVVEIVHALAESQKKRLTSHGDIKRYVRTLAQQRQDKEIYELFQKAEAFHANFYHGFMDESDVRDMFPFVQELLERIGNLLTPGQIGG